MDHTATVQDIYAAFGRGDVPAILEHLSDDVEWEYGSRPIDVPWLQPRQGKEEAAKFFDAVRALEIHRLEPTALLADGSLVVALVDLEATVEATGERIVEIDEVHIWRFDDEGRVARFRHRVDTLQHAQAWESTGSELAR